MESCRGSRDSPFVTGKDTLETLHVLWFGRTLHYMFGQRSLAKRIQGGLELVVRPVVQETERTPARRRIVDDFCHHGIIFTEVQLVTYTDLTGRVDQHIPQAQVLIQLPQQEHFDTCTRLFLVAIKAGWEHLSIIEDKHILVVEIVKDVFKVLAMLDIPAFLVQHHQTGFVTMARRILGNLFFRQFEFEL